jgi:hypothetical protein
LEFSDTCAGGDIANGILYPSEVIEGSSVTARCENSFKLEGDWILKCQYDLNRGLSLDRELPICTPLKSGNHVYGDVILLLIMRGHIYI